MAQNQTPLSFHVSDAQLNRLAKQVRGSHGRRSEIVRLAILNYGNPDPAEYIAFAPRGPFTNKINVARGAWYTAHQKCAEDLGVSVAALARYALEKMLQAQEELERQ